MPLRLLLAATLAAATAHANLLLNPDFGQWTDDSTPSLWRVESRTRTRVQRESDTFHTASPGCKLTRLVSGTGNNSGLMQRVAVTTGAPYSWSVWCRDESPLVSLGMVVSWRGADSGYLNSSGITYSTDIGGWQLLADSAVAPDSAAFADVILRTYGVAGASAGERTMCDDAEFARTQAVPESISVWFVQDSLAARLIAFFDAATSSIDYCCYNSSRPDVGLALMRAHDRGVRVRVVTDNTRLDDSWVAYLRGSGIPVWSDSGSTGAGNYMHNKFAVRDLEDADSTNDLVWNASYNPNECETHADYGMELPSASLARAYRLEFNQMWGDTGMVPNPGQARFHGSKTDVLPSHSFTVCGIPTQLYFSPQNRVVDSVEAVAALAQHEIGFAVNSFTYDDLGIAMLTRWGASCRVFGTFDRANTGDSASEYHRLSPAGVPVLVDSVPFGSGTLHEKIMVVDSERVVCGSANWSNNANYSNDENTLILRSPELARLFHAEIVRRYVEAGGVYPPGITEGRSQPVRIRAALASPRAVPPSGARVFDAIGRQVKGAVLSDGVYVIVFSVGPAHERVVVVR
jgi:hypothetical protein